MLSVTAVCTAALAGQALAQTSAAPAAPMAPTAPATAATPATAAPAAPAAAAVGVTVGLPVKDVTGAVIGQISEVTAGPSGQQVAVIKMGEDVFTVETAKLQVKEGAAHVYATEAQIRQLMGKPKA
jgi:hypothetical protein